MSLFKEKKIREFDVKYKRIKPSTEPLAKQLRTKIIIDEKKVKTYLIMGSLLLSFFILLNIILIDFIFAGKIIGVVTALVVLLLIMRQIYKIGIK